MIYLGFICFWINYHTHNLGRGTNVFPMKKMYTYKCNEYLKFEQIFSAGNNFIRSTLINLPSTNGYGRNNMAQIRVKTRGDRINREQRRGIQVKQEKPENGRRVLCDIRFSSTTTTNCARLP